MNPHDPRTLDRRASDALDEAERRLRRKLTLADLERDGPPVKLRDLCALTGFTKEKFYADIERGTLDARRVGNGEGRWCVWVVTRQEALRHLRKLGVAA